MKFLADMGISARTVAHLREMGHDSVHLRDEHMQRSGDAAVLQKPHATDLANGAIISVNEKRIRVRRLPIQ